MKKAIPFLLSGGVILALKSCFFGKTKIADATLSNSDSAATIYHLSLNSLDGKSKINLSDFKGKKILIVNTASECGFTPQYEGLQKLYEQYGSKLAIVGTPCNQFGNQEPGDSGAIRGFCQKNYGVTFPISQKLDVRGSNQHPLYAWLTQKKQNGVLEAEVRWNFNKFLISESGKLLAYFPSNVTPDSPELTKFFAQ